MSLPPLHVTRMPQHLISDNRRVITRLFAPGDEGRIRRIIERVQSLSGADAGALLHQVRESFADRHKDVEEAFEQNFDEVAAPLIAQPEKLPRERRLLIGAYFTMEYSIEAAALFNPSIVAHPNQSGLPSGALRFIMSLRATGEGHVSSIAFRTGIVQTDGQIEFHRVSRYVEAAQKVRDRVYHKHTFFLKLIEMGAYNEFAQAVLDRLGRRVRLHGSAPHHQRDELRQTLSIRSCRN